MLLWCYSFLKFKEPSKCIVEAYEEVANTIETMNGVLLNVDTYHEEWYRKAEALAKSVGSSESKSRSTVFSLFWSNTPADDIKTFYRRDITLPCLNAVSKILKNWNDMKHQLGLKHILFHSASLHLKTVISINNTRHYRWARTFLFFYKFR